VIRWCLGQDAPLSVTAVGGTYAGIKDDREIPDTLQVLWEFNGPTLVVFEQYNANATPGNARNSVMELRGTKGTLYIRYASWEVVPEKIADAYTGYDQGTGYGNPVNRDSGSRVAASLKTVIEPKTVQAPSGYNTTSHTRNSSTASKPAASATPKS
jgi:predicted dehydrogenase